MYYANQTMPIIQLLVFLVLYYLVFIKEAKHILITALLFFICGMVISRGLTYFGTSGDSSPAFFEERYNKSVIELKKLISEHKENEDKNQALNNIYIIVDKLRYRSGNKIMTKAQLGGFMDLVIKGNYEKALNALNNHYDYYISNSKVQYNKRDFFTRWFDLLYLLNILIAILALLSLAYKGIRLRNRMYVLEL